MPRNAPITRKRFSSTISILLEERLRTLAENTGRKMSELLDEAIIKLLNEYSREGGITMVDELKKVKTEHVLCVASYKGGVGKTTTIAELAYLFSHKGKKQVLIIDADGQANITERMECVPDQDNSIEMCLTAAMDKKPLNVETYITPTKYKGVDIISGASAIGQSDFQTDMQKYRSRTGKNPYQKIVDAVKNLERYDIVLVDTHPAATDELLYPLQASTDLICPASPDNDGVKGALSAYAQMVDSREATPDLRYLGTFFNRVDPRTARARTFVPSAQEGMPEYIEQINDGEKEGRVFKTTIRASEDVGKAVDFRCAVSERFHGKAVARDFEKLYDEVVSYLG